MLPTLKPYPHQERIINAICSQPATAVWALMGAGKTAATLEAIRRLKGACLINRALVIAPKRVACHTWPNERNEWANFSNLSMAVASGGEASRLRAINRKCDVTMIGRDNVTWLCEYYFGKEEELKEIKDILNEPQHIRCTRFLLGLAVQVNSLVGFYSLAMLAYLQENYGWYISPVHPPLTSDKWPFDAIIIDESTSFKDNGSQRWKKLAKVMPFVSKRVTLTGTPAPNCQTEHWAQYYLLDKGQRLLPFYSHFERRYFCFPLPYKTTPLPGTVEAIAEAVKDITVVVDSYAGLPEISYIKEAVSLTPDIMLLYKELEKEFILDKGQELITAGSSAILANKLLQLSGGAVYSDVDPESNKKAVVPIHNQKIEALKEMLEFIPDENVLVCYNFKHELDRLLKAFPKSVLLKSNNSLDDWNSGKIKIGLAHPASLGHGLNLQKGGRRLIWYSPTANNELFLQMNTRLYRTGQKNHVFIHTLVATGTVDEIVCKTVVRREDMQKAMVDLVASYGV